MLRLLRLCAALSIASTAACSTHTSSDAGRPAPLPSRSGPLTNVGEASSGLALAGDKIVVDLETTPDPRTSWGTTACLAVLPPDFVIGQATCTTDATRSQPITAADTEQVCTNAEDGKFAPVEPAAALAMANCPSVTISIYQFSPALSVRVVKQ